jgi:PTH1 family peptidyl-tRNA hydrolase
LNIDYCIIGLGNPGSKYFNTRHNIGFQVIDKLAEFFKIPGFEFEENYIAAPAGYKDKKLMLVKPVTFMNLSGEAVKLIADTYGLEAGRFLIIYDDANIPYGTLRLRPSGSDGGQNGIASVIYNMQTEDIPRLRVGIGNEEELEKSSSLADFVLSDFTVSEAENLDEIVNKAKEAVLSYIDEGISAAMNKFNADFLGDNKPSNGENNTNPN